MKGNPQKKRVAFLLKEDYKKTIRYNLKGGVLMKKYLKLIEFSDKKSVWLFFFVHSIMTGFNIYVSFLLQKGISFAMFGKGSEVFDALCLMLVGVIIYI